MITKTTSIIALLLFQILVSCNNKPAKQVQAIETTASETAESHENPSIAYESERLTIHKISPHVLEHTTFLETESFGKVPCNGMVVVDHDEAVVFDTPTNNEDAQELIDYLTKDLKLTIKAVVATHFHADCLGGLEAFHRLDIPSYANELTINFAKAIHSAEPQNGFQDELVLQVGNKKVYAAFLGEGHTKDNIIGYFPDDSIMFGGCLIKEMGAGKGNLEDANVSAWTETVRKVKLKYPETKIVIPGHGTLGGTALFDYTISLFKS